MHEMSIAMNIIEIAEKEVLKARATRVESIDLEVGLLSGIVLDALEFALDEAVKQTILENSEIRITTINAEARCLKCNNIFHTSDFFTPCPKCNSFESEIIKGKELKIKSLVVT
jgi:hydrogenase nickel incorporation protein HypA/HybF